MPSAGRAAYPSENIFSTNSSIRLDVCSSVSKKIPPKKGLKKASIIVSENCHSCKKLSDDCSGCLNSWGIDRRLWRLRRATILILSAQFAMGFRIGNTRVGIHTLLYL